jgi:hypothetical protein
MPHPRRTQISVEDTPYYYYKTQDYKTQDRQNSELSTGT